MRPRPDPPPLLERLLLGSQPRPQLILLDHGVYVSLPGDLRRLYCQLWCAIVLGDTATARQVRRWWADSSTRSCCRAPFPALTGMYVLLSPALLAALLLSTSPAPPP